MTVLPEKAVPQSAVQPKPDAASDEAETRRRAKSVPGALPLTPVAPPGTDAGANAESLIREALARFLGAFAVPKDTNVLHACGLHAAHHRHKQAAGGWGRAGWARQVWGWLHLLLKACLFEPLDWVTESPARTITAVALLAACTHWL